MSASQFGAALAALVPALLAGWRAASLRGDIFHKWSDRVDIAHAGLNERANSELLGLQAEIGEALSAGTGTEFPPAEVWADAGPLVTRAERCAALLRSRDKLRGRFRRHRQLGPILIPTVAAYVAGWLIATLYYTEVIQGGRWKLLGFALCGLAFAVGLAVFALYAYFESKLAAAEEMAAGDR